MARPRSNLADRIRRNGRYPRVPAPRAEGSGGMSRHRSRPESQIQRAEFQHLRARGAPGVFAFHPANGGYRKPVEAAVMKGMGVIAGVPDLIAICQGALLRARTQGS